MKKIGLLIVIGLFCLNVNAQTREETEKAIKETVLNYPAFLNSFQLKTTRFFLISVF